MAFSKSKAKKYDLFVTELYLCLMCFPGINLPEPSQQVSYRCNIFVGASGKFWFDRIFCTTLHRTKTNNLYNTLVKTEAFCTINLKEGAAGNYEHFRLKVSQTGYFGHYILP